jgi:hypothetical protein
MGGHRVQTQRRAGMLLARKDRKKTGGPATRSNDETRPMGTHRAGIIWPFTVKPYAASRFECAVMLLTASKLFS